MTTRKRFGLVVTAGALALGVSVSAAAAGAASAATSIKGQTINVAIAYPAPKAMLRSSPRRPA